MQGTRSLRRTARHCGLALSAGLAGLLVAGPSLADETDLFCPAGGGVFADEKLDVKKGSAIHGGPAYDFTHVATNGKAKIDASTIHGDLHVGKKLELKHDAVVTGAIVEDAAPVLLDDVSAMVAAHASSHHNGSIGLTDAGRVALEKDDKLKVHEGDRLVLGAGDYYLREVYLKKDAELVVDGDVRIFMKKGKFKSKRASVVPGENGGSLQIVIAEKGGAKIHASLFHGSIYAPKGKVSLKKGSAFSGALAVDKLKVDASEIHSADVCGGEELTTPEWEPPLWTPDDEYEWSEEDEA